MTRYVVSRSRAWLSDEELAAFTECAPAIADLFKDHVRWIRSDIVREEDGTLSAVCLYDATSPEWLREYSDAAMLPADSIRPLAASLAA